METVMAVLTPRWILVYEGKNITAPITPYVLSVRYTDHLEGQSDEVEIVVEDSAQRWKNAWYPQKGDQLNLQIGYENDPNGLMPCGDFQVDQVEMAGPPDTVTIRGLAAAITPALRTRKSKAFENTTLGNIAQAVAAQYGYSVVGIIEDSPIARITQNRERDLQFLRRVAADYGYVFSLRGNRLVFYRRDDLQNNAVIATIDRKTMTSFSLKDKTSRIYRAAKCSYWDPKTKKLLTAGVSNKGVKGGDTLVITERCENRKQAVAKAKAALQKANIRQVEGNLTFPGNPLVLAGSNIEVTGMGQLSDTYMLRQTTHSIDRDGGYATDAEVISHA